MLGNSYQKGPVIWAHIFGMLVWIKTHFIRSRGSVSKWNALQEESDRVARTVTMLRRTMPQDVQEAIISSLI